MSNNYRLPKKILLGGLGTLSLSFLGTIYFWEKMVSNTYDELVYHTGNSLYGDLYYAGLITSLFALTISSLVVYTYLKYKDEPIYFENSYKEPSPINISKVRGIDKKYIKTSKILPEEEATIIKTNNNEYIAGKDNYEEIKRIYSIAKGYKKSLYIITDNDGIKEIPIYGSFGKVKRKKEYYLYLITEDNKNLDEKIKYYKPIILTTDESGEIKSYSLNNNMSYEKPYINNEKAKEIIDITKKINGIDLRLDDLYNQNLEEILDNYRALPIEFTGKDDTYAVMIHEGNYISKKKITDILFGDF